MRVKSLIELQVIDLPMGTYIIQTMDAEVGFPTNKW